MSKRIILYSLLILGAVIVSYIAVHRWFSGNTILYYWDAYIPYGDNTFIRNFYAWQNNFFPGAGGIALSWQLYLFSFSFLRWITKSISLSQEMLYIVLIMLSIVTFYHFVKHLIVKSVKSINSCVLEIVSIFFGLAYALNLYTFYYSYFMFNPQIYIYAILPLHVLALFKLYPLDKAPSMKKGRFLLWLLVFYLSGFFMIPGFTSYIFFAQYLVMLGVYFCFFLLVQPKSIRLPRLFSASLFLFSIICFNWWWFGPSLLSLRQLYESQSGLGTDIYIDLGSEHNNLLNSLRLLGSAMMNNNAFSWSTYYIDNSVFTFPLYIFIAGCVYVFFHLKKLIARKTIVFLASVFLVTVFIVKLGNPPLEWVIRFSFRYIPFFGAFRDAFQKAGMFYIYSYYAVAAVGIYLCLSYFVKMKKMLTYLLGSIILIIVLIIQTGPFYLFSYDNIQKVNYAFNGIQYQFSAKTKFPNSYYDLKDFMESYCNGKVTLVVPRTAMLSSGTWEKEGYSYIGQDILPRLINCSFVSVHTMQNDSDAFTTVPYMLILQGKMDELKNFLIRNGIQVILIRKDYIPYYYYYTQHTTVDSQVVKNVIEKDNDYSKLYDNEYFTVYELKNTSSVVYGFSVTNFVMYTNAKMRESREYYNAALYLSEDNPLIINDSDIAKKFKDKTNGYFTIANCVGCVKMDLKAILTPTNKNVVTEVKKQIKNIAKTVLGIKMPSYTESEQISLEIINMNDIFLPILEQLKNPDKEKIRLLIKDYLGSLETILTRIEQMNAGYFDKNYKYIELNNFLTIEHSTFVDALEQGKTDTKIESMQLRELVLELLLYQREALALLNRTMWVTEYSKGKLNIRLDIPVTGLYDCKALSFNSGAHLKGISGDMVAKSFSKNADSFLIQLDSGSYPITIDYSMDTMVSIPSVDITTNTGKEIPLGRLPNGDYSISAQQNASNGMSYLIVSSKKLTFGELRSASLTADTDNFVFLVPISTQNGHRLIEYGFSVFSLDNSEYYLYIIPFYFIEDGKTIYGFQDIRVTNSLRHDDIQLSCAQLPKVVKQEVSQPIVVTKKSPVKYVIRLQSDINGQFITFNESYHQSWKAYAIVNGKKHVFQHLKNTYANAWYIDKPGVTEITIEFSQQKDVIRIIFISITLFIITLITYIFYEKRV